MVHDSRYRHDVEQPATKEYDVEVNGVRTTLRLADADAKARGLIKGTEAVVDPAAPVSAVRQSVSDEDPNLPNVGTTQTTDPYASAGAVGDRSGSVGEIAAADEVGPDGGTATPGDGEKASRPANKARTAANKGAAGSDR